ncbi:uncharacterized protein LOC131630939 [Vicia villosa]|uniref:uncharacterized protein LOC131630939 n=1 Tax=Vicia villosa TaxID=3911 RepID=UPI00273B5847|nr:uncharacterized protein LOC131630939 [Vicia villosa]
MDRARHDRMHKHASKTKVVIKKSAGPRLEVVQSTPTIGSGTSSSSPVAVGSPFRAFDQGDSLRPATEELKARDQELADLRASLSAKEDALDDVQGQYTLLYRTLYGVMLSSSIREASLRWFLAPAEDEIDEEKALLTRADLIQYIRVLGKDCVAAAEDTYNSIVAQLKLKNPRVDLTTEGTGPYLRVEGDQIVSPEFKARCKTKLILTLVLFEPKNVVLLN